MSGGFPGPGSCLIAPRQPRQAQLLQHRGLFRPNSCLSWPAQRRELLPHTDLSWPRSSLTPVHFGTAHASHGFSRPSSCLWVASPDPASTSQWALSGPDTCLAVAPLGQTSALLWPSSCLPVASVGQAHASTTAFPGLAFAALHPLQALHFLQSASLGPALPLSILCRPKLPSSWPLRGQLLPPRCLCRHKSSSNQLPQPQLLPFGSLYGCTTSSYQPLQAQLLLPPHGLFRPSPARASWWPSQALLLTFVASSVPELDLQWASLGPAACLPKACVQVQLLLHSGLSHAQAAASLRPPQSKVLPSGSFDRPHSSLPMASSGPAHPSQLPFQAKFVPFWRTLQSQKLLKLASPAPAAASRCPLQAQLFLPAASTGPIPAS
ncbi:uncharacterized protein LOC117079856 [Trachypithecus francoisi]|uniref:uncharacterized protein LOC117079856 n=1 Tax=Trachypithecus francoisi TaxID=54180 RepID=UPI00141B4382|nr:uncharacterized protein LOC117079856 [Trachypithecus francoisi]